MRSLPFLFLAVPALAVPCTVSAAGDGAKVFETACADCHHPKRLPLDDKHLSRREWKEVIDNMIEKERVDPALKKDQYESLLDWLVATHGPPGGGALATDGAGKK